MKAFLYWLFPDLHISKGGVSDRPTTPQPPPPRGQGGNDDRPTKIDEMDAGPKMDGLVAKYLMGFPTLHPELPHKMLPYSTDIAFAWKVVEAIEEETTKLTLLRGQSSQFYWTAQFGGSIPGRGETAPLAICRAALKWAGV